MDMLTDNLLKKTHWILKQFEVKVYHPTDATVAEKYKSFDKFGLACMFLMNCGT